MKVITGDIAFFYHRGVGGLDSDTGLLHMGPVFSSESSRILPGMHSAR